MVLTSRQQRRPSRRTQRRRMELVVDEPAIRHALERRTRNRTTEGRHRPEPDIVEHHQQHIRTIRRFRRPQRTRRRLADQPADLTLERRSAEPEDRSRPPTNDSEIEHTTRRTIDTGDIGIRPSSDRDIAPEAIASSSPQVEPAQQIHPGRTRTPHHHRRRHPIGRTGDRVAHMQADPLTVEFHTEMRIDAPAGALRHHEHPQHPDQIRSPTTTPPDDGRNRCTRLRSNDRVPSASRARVKHQLRRFADVVRRATTRNTAASRCRSPSSASPMMRDQTGQLERPPRIILRRAVDDRPHRIETTHGSHKARRPLAFRMGEETLRIPIEKPE